MLNARWRSGQLRAALLALVLSVALAACQSRHDCVVTPNDTVECN